MVSQSTVGSDPDASQTSGFGAGTEALQFIALIYHPTRKPKDTPEVISKGLKKKKKYPPLKNLEILVKRPVSHPVTHLCHKLLLSQGYCHSS